MDSITKRNAALKLLKTTGIGEGSYAPLGVKVLWQLGFDCPPPHLASFAGTALVAGIYFAVVWGLIMSFLGWPQNTFSVIGGLAMSIGAGTFFGLSMASYYAFGRRKHNLPNWNDFNPSSES